MNSLDLRIEDLRIEDLCTEDIANDFADEANLRSFIFHHILKNNDALGSKRDINREHLYSIRELSLVLNIAKDHLDTFKKIVEPAGAGLVIGGSIYYSLIKLIASGGFIRSISPLTNFAIQES